MGASPLGYYVLLISNRAVLRDSPRAFRLGNANPFHVPVDFMIVWRIARILGGVFLAFANSSGEDGTFLGFLPPDSPGRIGWDIAKLLLYWLAGWLIYRAVWPKPEIAKAPR